jgi:hypothetical protein
MKRIQRRMAEGIDVVTEGRDQGSVVFPQAELKVFLTASPEERARRRHREELGRGHAPTLESVLESQSRRDDADCARPVGAMRQADDAVVALAQQYAAHDPDAVATELAAASDAVIAITAERDAAQLAIRDLTVELAVNPNDPVITKVLARYAEILNGVLQTQGLNAEQYIWRSQDDSRVRSAHAAYDDHIFSWSDPPDGGHPGQGWNCRCTAEPVLDGTDIPDGAVCDILTGDRLATVFPAADTEKRAAIAREVDLRVVSGQLDTRERLIHFLAQMRQEAGDDAQLVEGFLAGRCWARQHDGRVRA